MAKRFHFDDEDIQEQEYEFDNQYENFNDMNETFENTDVEQSFEEDNQSMVKKKKKFVWKWWHYLLIILVVLMIAFGIYIFNASQNDGPVYGTRCEGMVTIPSDNITSTINTMKKEYSQIKDLTIEVECRELRVDIVFEDGMSTKKAQSIAEKTVQTLDDLVGKPKEDGKKYSTLFGTIDGVTQYEVDLFMVSENSEDFPMYGIKHTSKDEFSYTLASIKDQKSYDAARETLEKKKEN